MFLLMLFMTVSVTSIKGTTLEVLTTEALVRAQYAFDINDLRDFDRKYDEIPHQDKRVEKISI